jgi:hypothetical protein
MPRDQQRLAIGDHVICLIKRYRALQERAIAASRIQQLASHTTAQPAPVLRHLSRTDWTGVMRQMTPSQTSTRRCAAERRAEPQALMPRLERRRRMRTKRAIAFGWSALGGPRLVVRACIQSKKTTRSR